MKNAEQYSFMSAYVNIWRYYCKELGLHQAAYYLPAMVAFTLPSWECRRKCVRQIEREADELRISMSTASARTLIRR